MNNIRNIIFDLGGVLYNISYQATLDAFALLGMKDFESFFTQADQVQLFDRLDRGEVSGTDFCRELRQLSGLNISDNQIYEAWNAMLLDFPLHHLDLLAGVGARYRIFLLSNTNEIHYPVYQHYMLQNTGFAGLDHLFEKSYLSYKIKKRKPETEAYLMILDENALVAEETLFIDDTHQHVVGARNAGLKAVWLDLTQLKVGSLFNHHYLLRSEVEDLC